MTAVVRVGVDPEGLFLERFQPMCLEHEPVWFGPETFDLATAKANARVHNADRHRPEAPVERDVCPWHPDSPETCDRDNHLEQP